VGQISKIYEFKNYISNLYPVLKKNKKYTLVAIGYDGQGGFEKKTHPGHHWCWWPGGFLKKCHLTTNCIGCRLLIVLSGDGLVFLPINLLLLFQKLKRCHSLFSGSSILDAIVLTRII
jgi:hypothetical protein